MPCIVVFERFDASQWWRHVRPRYGDNNWWNGDDELSPFSRVAVGLNLRKLWWKPTVTPRKQEPSWEILFYSSRCRVCWDRSQVKRPGGYFRVPECMQHLFVRWHVRVSINNAMMAVQSAVFSLNVCTSISRTLKTVVKTTYSLHAILSIA